MDLSFKTLDTYLVLGAKWQVAGMCSDLTNSLQQFFVALLNSSFPSVRGQYGNVKGIRGWAHRHVAPSSLSLHDADI